MLPALHYTHFCLLLIFKCSVERLQLIRKWVGYYGKMPVPSFHCCLGACYTQALPHRHTGWDTQALPRIFTLFWIPKKSVIKSSHPKKFQYLKFQTPENPLIIPINWNQESKSEKSTMGTSNKQQNTYRSVKGILVNLLHTSLKKTATKRCRLRIVPNSLGNCASKRLGVWAKWLIPVSIARSS